MRQVSWRRPPEGDDMPGAVEQNHVRAEPDPAAVADDLRRRVEGEVLFDSLHRTLYSTAACIYQVLPLGAVVPRHEGDVLAVLDYARGHRGPITARGGRSGLAGHSVCLRNLHYLCQHR